MVTDREIASPQSWKSSKIVRKLSAPKPKKVLAKSWTEAYIHVVDIVSTLSRRKYVEDQDVPTNDVARELAVQYPHLKIDPPDEDGFWTVTDRDPELRAKKVKLPKHRGLDVSVLVRQAISDQEARRQKPTLTVVETVVEPEPVVETVVQPTVGEFLDSLLEPEQQEIVEDEPEEDEDEAPTNVVALRRAVLTEDDLAVPPSILTDVVLD